MVHNKKNLNKKELIAVTISKIWTVAVIFFVLYLVNVGKSTQSIVVAGFSIATFVISLVVLREKYLKKWFFISSLILFNFAMLNYWNEMSTWLKAAAFSAIAIQVSIAAIPIYKRLTRNNYSYIPKTEKSEINISEFCRSKHSDRRGIDECMAKLTGRGN